MIILFLSNPDEKLNPIMDDLAKMSEALIKTDDHSQLEKLLSVKECFIFCQSVDEFNKLHNDHKIEANKHFILLFTSHHVDRVAEFKLRQQGVNEIIHKDVFKSPRSIAYKAKLIINSKTKHKH